MIQKIIDRIDKIQRKRPYVSFPFAVIKKYGDDEAGKQAALLAYYGFLSLFPLLMVLTTALGMFLRGESELRQTIVEGATDYFSILGDNLQKNVQGMDGSGIALVIGILITLFGARGVADIFRGAVNHVWQVPYVKRTGFPMAIFSSLSIIGIGGLGMLSAPLISGYAINAGHGSVLFRLAALLITLGILFGVFIVLFRLALSEKRPYRDLWVGAFIAALGLMILQSLGTYLLANHLKNLDELYGTFAIVLGLLFWLYLQTQVLLYAMEIDSVRVLKLWPRALDQKKLTKADRSAFRLYAHRNKFHDEEEIDVTTKKRSLLERFTTKDS